MTEHRADKQGSEVAQEFAYVVEHGTSPEAAAIRTLRSFMCCKAGRDLVEHGLIRPFRVDETYRAEGMQAERARVAADLRDLHATDASPTRRAVYVALASRWDTPTPVRTANDGHATLMPHSEHDTQHDTRTAEQERGDTVAYLRPLTAPCGEKDAYCADIDGCNECALAEDIAKHLDAIEAGTHERGA